MAVRKGTTAVSTLALIALAAAGCAKPTVTTMRYPLNPEPNTCQVDQADPTMRGGIVTNVCWDKHGNAIGQSSAPATSKMDVILGVAQSGATVIQGVATYGAATVLGHSVKEAVRAANGMTINAVTTGTVGGTVNVGSIPDVNGTLQLIAP